MPRRLLEDRKEIGFVERPTVDVGENLDAARAQRHGAVDLGKRRLDIVERQ